MRLQPSLLLGGWEKETGGIEVLSALVTDLAMPELKVKFDALVWK